MEDLKPTNKTDKQLLSHLRWASDLLANKALNLKVQDQFVDIKKIDELKKNGFWTIIYGGEEEYFDYNQYQEQRKKISLRTVFFIQVFYDSGIIPAELQPFKDCKTLFRPGLEWQTLFYFKVIHGPLNIRKKTKSHEGKVSVEILDERYSTRAYKKAIAGLGWAKREWDGVPLLFIHPDKPYIYLDYLLQMSVYTVQKGFLTDSEAILDIFKTYIQRFKEPSRDGENTHPIIKTFHYIDEDLEREAVNKIVKNYFLPKTPASFESYVWRTLYERIWYTTITHPGKEVRKQQRRLREEFIMNKEKQGKSREAARREWYRKFQEIKKSKKESFQEIKNDKDICIECLHQSFCSSPCPEKLMSEKE